jgi:hypothetical protein
MDCTVNVLSTDVKKRYKKLEECILGLAVGRLERFFLWVTLLLVRSSELRSNAIFYATCPAHIIFLDLICPKIDPI